MFLKPARAGLRVPIPGAPGRVLPEEGAEVVEETYWLRRLADGDVVEALPPVPEDPTPAEEHRARKRKE